MSDLDIKTDEEGYAVVNGERLLNPFDNQPVKTEELEAARRAKVVYAVNAATFVLNVLSNDAEGIDQMLNDDELTPIGMLGGLTTMIIEFLAEWTDNPEAALFSYIEAQAPGLVNGVFDAVEQDLIEEGISEDEVATSIAKAKAFLSGKD